MTDLTHVDVLWFKKRIENWIRFGRIAEERVVDRGGERCRKGGT